MDSPEIDEFHKTVGLSSLYRGKGVTNPKEVIVILQASILFIISESENIFLATPYLVEGHIYSTTKIISWLSDYMKRNSNKRYIK